MVKGRRQQIQGPGNADKQPGAGCGKLEMRLKRKATLGSEGSLGWWGPLKEGLGRKELGIPRDTAVKINCIWLLTGYEPGRELDNSRTLCTEFSGKNIGVGSESLLQGIFWTQGLNLGLLHCKWILYHLSHQGILRRSCILFSFFYLPICYYD